MTIKEAFRTEAAEAELKRVKEKVPPEYHMALDQAFSSGPVIADELNRTLFDALSEIPPDWDVLGDLHVPGAKDDGSKLPVRSLVLEYFPRALLAVAAISAYGANKYTAGGWKTVENGVTRYGDAGARHVLNAIIEGENDPETGELHAAHEAWNALARLELIIKEREDG